METDIGTITAATLAAAATGVGAPLWAGILMLVIDTLKGVPQLNRFVRGYEKLWAFVLAGLLIVVAFVVAIGQVPPAATLDAFGVFLAILAWFAVARLTMSFYDDLMGTERLPDGSHTSERKRESLLHPAGWTGQ